MNFKRVSTDAQIDRVTGHGRLGPPDITMLSAPAASIDRAVQHRSGEQHGVGTGPPKTESPDDTLKHHIVGAIQAHHILASSTLDGGGQQHSQTREEVQRRRYSTALISK